MSRTFMMVILALSIVTISYAQESFNRLCMDGSQQPHMTPGQQPHITPDCTNSYYQSFIEDEVRETESSVSRLLNSMKGFLEEIEDRSRLSFSESYLDSAQNNYRWYVEKMMYFQKGFIKNTHNGDFWERKCMLGEYKLKLWSQYLLHLDGEMKFLCQFYSQKFMPQKPVNTPMAPKGFKVKK